LMKIRTRTSQETQITLTGIDSVKFIIDAGVIPKNGVMPGVTFKVPSGADWSSLRVDITADHPITISFTEETLEGM